MLHIGRRCPAFQPAGARPTIAVVRDDVDIGRACGLDLLSRSCSALLRGAVVSSPPAPMSSLRCHGGARGRTQHDLAGAVPALSR